MGENYVAKIADFGLSRGQEVYVKKTMVMSGEILIPIVITLLITCVEFKGEQMVGVWCYVCRDDYPCDGWP